MPKRKIEEMKPSLMCDEKMPSYSELELKDSNATSILWCDEVVPPSPKKEKLNTSSVKKDRQYFRDKFFIPRITPNEPIVVECDFKALHEQEEAEQIKARDNLVSKLIIEVEKTIANHLLESRQKYLAKINETYKLICDNYADMYEKYVPLGSDLKRGGEQINLSLKKLKSKEYYDIEEPMDYIKFLEIMYNFSFVMKNAIGFQKQVAEMLQKVNGHLHEIQNFPMINANKKLQLITCLNKIKHWYETRINVITDIRNSVTIALIKWVEFYLENQEFKATIAPIIKDRRELFNFLQSFHEYVMQQQEIAYLCERANKELDEAFAKDDLEKVDEIKRKQVDPLELAFATLPTEDRNLSNNDNAMYYTV